MHLAWVKTNDCSYTEGLPYSINFTSALFHHARPTKALLHFPLSSGTLHVTHPNLPDINTLIFLYIVTSDNSTIVWL